MKKSISIIAAAAMAASLTLAGTMSAFAADEEPTTQASTEAATEAEPSIKIADIAGKWKYQVADGNTSVDKAAKDYAGKIDFYSVDVDHNKSIARQLGISSIPFLLFCPVGQQPQGNMGLISRDELDNIINEYLLKTAP